MRLGKLLASMYLLSLTGCGMKSCDAGGIVGADGGTRRLGVGGWIDPTYGHRPGDSGTDTFQPVSKPTNPTSTLKVCEPTVTPAWESDSSYDCMKKDSQAANDLWATVEAFVNKAPKSLAGVCDPGDAPGNNSSVIATYIKPSARIIQLQYNATDKSGKTVTVELYYVQARNNATGLWASSDNKCSQ